MFSRDINAQMFLYSVVLLVSTSFNFGVLLVYISFSFRVCYVVSMIPGSGRVTRFSVETAVFYHDV